MRCCRIAQVLVPVPLVHINTKSQTFTASFEQGYPNSQSSIAEFTAGVNFKCFGLRTEIDAPLSKKVKDRIILKSVIAYRFDAQPKSF